MATASRAQRRYGKVKSYAEGGNMPAMSPAMTGEDGPEIAVPTKGAAPAAANQDEDQKSEPKKKKTVHEDGIFEKLWHWLFGKDTEVDDNSTGSKKTPNKLSATDLPIKSSGADSGGSGGDTQDDSDTPGRAKGGPVKSGEPYMVGEKGPEVVVPKEDAMVIPAHITDALLKLKASGQTDYGKGLLEKFHAKQFAKKPGSSRYG